MTHPDNNFKNKLFNHETPLGSNVSFDKVMAMRSKKPAILWWKPTLLVVATLTTVTAVAYFMGAGASSSRNGKSSEQTAVQPQQKTEQSSLNQINQSNSAQPAETVNEVAAYHNTGNSGQIAGVATSAEKVNTQSPSEKTGIQPENGIHSDRQTPVEKTEPGVITDNQDKVVASSSIDLYSGLKTLGIRALFQPWNIDLGHQLGFTERELNHKNATPFSFEAMLVTGGVNYRNFDDAKALSLRGTNHFGQYNFSAIYDLGKGFALSAGLGYTGMYGNGEWRKVETQTLMNTSSHIIRIVQPGLPDQYKTVYDTTYIPTKVAQTGNVSYHLSRVSLPIGFRYHFGEGKMLWRVSGTLAPGMISATGGTVFSRTQMLPIDKQMKQSATMDARIAFGLYMPVSTHLIFVAEPTLQYQSVFGKSWQGYNKFVTGFGVGLVFKP